VVRLGLDDPRDPADAALDVDEQLADELSRVSRA